MKEIQYLIEEVGFLDALKENTFQKVYETLNGTDKEMLSKNLKIYIFAFLSWLLSLTSSMNWIVFPICSTVITLVLIVVYLKSPRFFRSAVYTMTIFLFCQNAVVFYISSLKISDSRILNSSVAVVYILVSYFIAFYVVKIKLLDSIQTIYFTNNTNVIKSKTIKCIKILSSAMIIFITLLFAAMQFYRFNKWWLRDYNSNILSGLNGTFLGNVFSIVCVFIAIIVLLLITMIPTLFLNSEVVVNGLLLKKYAEEFRQEYDFTKEEWYGE